MVKIFHYLGEKAGSEALCYAIECVVGRGVSNTRDSPAIVSKEGACPPRLTKSLIRQELFLP